VKILRGKECISKKRPKYQVPQQRANEQEKREFNRPKEQRIKILLVSPFCVNAAFQEG